MPERRKELLTLINEGGIISAIRAGDKVIAEFWEHPKVQSHNSTDDLEAIIYVHEQTTRSVTFTSAWLTERYFLAFGHYKEYGGGGASHYSDDYWVQVAVRHQLAQNRVQVPSQSKEDKWELFLGSNEVKALKKEHQL